MTKCVAAQKDNVLSEIAAEFSQLDPYVDVKWVISIPAIWNNERVKDFIHKVAVNAGLIRVEGSDNLLFVTDVALATHGHLCSGDPYFFNFLYEYSSYMVLHCGAAFVELAAYEVVSLPPQLSLNTIAAPITGEWGSNCVVMEFNRFLAELLGPELYVPNEWPYDFASITRQFERIMERY